MFILYKSRERSRNEINEEKVRNAVFTIQKKCVAKAATVMNSTEQSTRKIFKKINFHMYRYAIVQKTN